MEGVYPQCGVLVRSLPRHKDMFYVDYFSFLSSMGTEIFYDKRLPLTFARIFKIIIWNFWGMKTNKQRVIKLI